MNWPIWPWCFIIYRPSKIFSGPDLLAVVQLTPSAHRIAAYAALSRLRCIEGAKFAPSARLAPLRWKRTNFNSNNEVSNGLEWFSYCPTPTPRLLTHLPKMRQIHDFSKSRFSTFWLAEPY